MSLQTHDVQDWAQLELGLPSMVWRHCRDGVATVKLLAADEWRRQLLDVTRARHRLPAGMYRLQIDGPWYGHERDVLLVPQGRQRVNVSGREFARVGVHTVALSRRTAVPRRSGTFWVRALTSRGAPLAGATATLIDGASLRIEVAGHIPKVSLAAAVPGAEACTYVLPMLYQASKDRSVGRLVLRRHGSALILTSQTAFGADYAIAAALNIGDVESAGRAAVARLHPASKDSTPPNGVEGALVAAALTASGRFASLSDWIGESLEDPVAASDFYAAMAEWYAQAGCHLAALNLLLQIPSLGKPVLARSYGTAMALLVAYASQGPVSRGAYDMATESTSTQLSRLAHGLERDPRAIEHVRGQELERWNRAEARQCAAALSRGVQTVDHDQLFLTYHTRLANRDEAKMRPLTRDQLRFALQSGWKRFDWRVFDQERQKRILNRTNILVSSSQIEGNME